ncbi:MAG: methyltransferase domain-containing protein [Alphaproteobacteria bacterium]|nr:methyltransferase domain-containing protein [Alphaproteobacteria bacterium]MCW5744530.1 methyltransferase domain-containing protein [Alphaproteobacteria bacterium]
MATDYTTARRNMIDGQLRPNGVLAAEVLQVFADLPRERFVPAERRSVAYSDEAVPLGGGRYLVEPMLLARMLQLLQPMADDTALVVGAGTGYGAAALARLVRSVVALECEPRLAAEARANLSALGASNVTVIEGPLAQGAAAKGPFSLILAEGSLPAIPDALTKQLADEGRLAAVIAGDVPGRTGQMRLGRQVQGVFSSRPIFDAGSPLLPGFEKPKAFVF